MAGVLRNGKIYQIPGGSSLIPHLGTVPEYGPAVPFETVHLLAPVPDAPNIYCVASNYRDHVREAGAAEPDKAYSNPWFFLKPRGSMKGPGEDIPIPRVSPNSIDWECELAIVIGKRGKHVPICDAASHIAGYTVFNDFSDRKFRPVSRRQDRPWDPFFDWLLGKWHDGFSSMGPVLVTPDEIPGNWPDVPLRLRVNGALRQNSATGNMIFSPADLVAFLSQVVTLQPGDVISTGTPGGVAATLNCPYLKPGDIVEAEVQGIGVLANHITAETPEETVCRS